MSKGALFILLGLVLSTAGIAQTGKDLFGESESRAFARYLLTSQQYRYAALELERIDAMASQPDPWIQSRLLLAYRKSGQAPLALLRGQGWEQSGDIQGNELSREYCRVMLVNAAYTELENFLASSQAISPYHRTNFQLGLLLLDSKWQDASRWIEEHPQLAGSPLTPLVEQGANLPRRSPLLAATFSTLVPGSGKVYAGRWKDGVFSFLVISTLSWRAIRGFQDKGIRSEFGWAFGVVATGFYVGNIWGSSQAAKGFNRRKRHELENRIHTVLLRD
jgi:hypothetical protein